MGAEDTFHGLKEGTEVVAHYTAKGTEKTAVEIDDVGKDGIKSMDGTITHLDRGGKTIAVKTADGTEDHSSCQVTPQMMRARISQRESRKPPTSPSTTPKKPARRLPTSSKKCSS